MNFSSSVAQHLERLDIGLAWFQRGETKGKAGKMSFFLNQRCTWSHPKKVEVVTNWCHPITVFELHSFFWFDSYYWWFLEGFAKLAAPLHQLVAGRHKVWESRRPEFNRSMVPAL